MAILSSWQLPPRIIELSVADTWQDAIKEWKIMHIEKLDNGEESDKCLCSHYPIRELCHVINKINHNKAIVGNHCIEKFTKEGSVSKEFSCVPKIFQALNRILKDPEASINDALIDEAQREGVFSSNDVKFYEDIRLKRNLTSKQWSYKNSLNQRLIDAIATSAKSSFRSLKADRMKSANPKLLEVALKKYVLTQQNYDFYMQIWTRAYSTLSDTQKLYKINLNDKIVTQLSNYFEAKQINNIVDDKPLKKRRIAKTANVNELD